MIGSPRVSHAVTSRRRHPQATPSNPKCLLSRSIPAGESRSRHNPAEESRRDSPIQPKVGFRFSVTDGIICASKSVEDSLLEPPSPVRPLGVALERDSSSRHWAEWAVPRTGKAGCSNPYGRGCVAARAGAGNGCESVLMPAGSPPTNGTMATVPLAFGHMPRRTSKTSPLACDKRLIAQIPKSRISSAPLPP